MTAQIIPFPKQHERRGTAHECPARMLADPRDDRAAEFAARLQVRAEELGQLAMEQ